MGNVQSFGLAAFETLVKQKAGRFCLGDTLTMADFVLLPQLFNARRFGLNLNEFPTLNRIEAEITKEKHLLPAFPDQQPDKPASAT